MPLVGVSQRRSRRDTGGREFAADRALRALASGSVTTEGVDERVGRYRKPAVTAFGNSQTGTKMDTGRLWCNVDSAAHVIELLPPSARCHGVAGSAARPSVDTAGPRWRSVIVTQTRPGQKQFGARLLPRARRARPSPSRLRLEVSTSASVAVAARGGLY